MPGLVAEMSHRLTTVARLFNLSSSLQKQILPASASLRRERAADGARRPRQAALRAKSWRGFKCVDSFFFELKTRHWTVPMGMARSAAIS